MGQNANIIRTYPYPLRVFKIVLTLRKETLCFNSNILFISSKEILFNGADIAKLGVSTDWNYASGRLLQAASS